MNRSPSASTRNAPSPRTASEISGWRPRASAPSHITVGWNCTNSTSAISAPARSASASAVAGGDLRVGGGLEDLADAAGREDDRAGAARRRRRRGWPSPMTCSVTPGGPAVRHEQVEDQGVLDDLDAGVLGGGEQGAADLGAGGVAAGVRDAAPVVAALAGQRDARRRRRGRSSAPSAISPRTASGPSVTSTRTASGSQIPTPAVSVSLQVLLGGVVGAERGGDAALRPARRPVVHQGLGDEQHPAGRRGRAAPRRGPRCRSRPRRCRCRGSSRVRAR